MTRSGRAASAALAAAGALLVVAGCGASGSSAAPRTAAATAASTTPKVHTEHRVRPNGKAVALRRTDYGRALVDGKGRALYLFTHDSGKSRCYDACANAWPPYLTKGQPRAVGKVAQAKLGSVRRSDGRRQVTYAGRPLYYYVGDRSPGDVNCQAAYEFGGYWYVVDRDGRAIR